MRIRWRYLFYALFALTGLICSIFTFQVIEDRRLIKTQLSIPKILSQDPAGTQQRLEREFKLSVRNKEPRLPLSDQQLLGIRKALYNAVKEKLHSTQWKAPSKVGENYFVSKSPMIFISRDFYLDDLNNQLAKRAISYRLRHRFKSLSDLHNHESDIENSQYYPYRAEIQAKVNRTELGGGRSHVFESRFEFRTSSPPFSESHTPPAAPWLPQHFLSVAQTGKFKNWTISPAHSLAEYLNQSPNSQKRYHLRTKLVVITSRLRFHVNMKNPWGSGPNPDQTFIISLDRADVYSGKPYTEFLTRSLYGAASRPAAEASFCEIEIEFERNTSTQLDKSIEQSPKLESIRKAFIHDQDLLKSILVKQLESLQYSAIPANKSKYQQAFDLIFTPTSPLLLNNLS